jgi:DMSO/TMAO reductase YedYZ molybdopterin-dependent catalytic subunit
MKKDKLPLGQNEISALPRWNIDHPGIVSENPKFDPEKWRLGIDGEVEKPLWLTWQGLLKIPAVDSTSNFHCVEGVECQKSKVARGQI